MTDACDNVDWLDDFPVDAELPICNLRREQIPLPELLTREGYQRVVTVRDVRFRFTAVSFRHYTSHVFLFEREVDGHWTQARVHTPDKFLVIELIRQFVGFIYAVIEAEPTVGCLKAVSRAQFSCPGFGPRYPRTPQYLGQLIGFSA